MLRNKIPWESCGLATKEKHIAVAIFYVREPMLSFGRREKHSALFTFVAILLHELIERLVNLKRNIGPIVETRTLKRLIVNRKTEWLYKMEHTPRRRAAPRNIPRIGRNLRFHQNHMKRQNLNLQKPFPNRHKALFFNLTSAIHCDIITLALNWRKPI